MAEQITITNDGLLVLAPAKINLFLLIAGKRADGYHEIETLMAKIDLYDELLFQKTDRNMIELSCDGRYLAPEGPENLVYKACELFCEQTGVKCGVKIRLTKNIPAGAGLGGGSSDAAAALVGMNRLFGAGLKTEELMELAGMLGSDIAFFLGGPLSFCSGRGEKIEEIREKISFSAFLVLPNVSVSTARVYANYRHNGGLYLRQKEQIIAFLEKKNIDLTTKLCANMLDRSCFELHPGLAKLKNQLNGLGIGQFILSGSGSAMYAILCTESTTEVRRIQLMLEKSIGCASLIVHNNRW